MWRRYCTADPHCAAAVLSGVVPSPAVCQLYHPAAGKPLVRVNGSVGHVACIIRNPPAPDSKNV